MVELIEVVVIWKGRGSGGRLTNFDNEATISPRRSRPTNSGKVQPLAQQSSCSGHESSKIMLSLVNSRP